MTGDTPLILNIRKLLAGRIDIIAEDQNVFQAKGLGKEGKSNNLYIAFSPKNPK